MKKYFLYSPGAGGEGNGSGGGLIGQATAEQIAEWKVKHTTGIYAVVVDGHIGYFKNPNRHEVNCAMAKADKDKALALFEELCNVTFIGGSDKLLTDDTLFLGVCQEVKVKLDGKKAVLVNL